jgi:hypothetical protein
MFRLARATDAPRISLELRSAPRFWESASGVTRPNSTYAGSTLVRCRATKSPKGGSRGMAQDMTLRSRRSNAILRGWHPIGYYVSW